jgi:O-glycosyl hydrolase
VTAEEQVWYPNVYEGGREPDSQSEERYHSWVSQHCFICSTHSNFVA